MNHRPARSRGRFTGTAVLLLAMCAVAAVTAHVAARAARQSRRQAPTATFRTQISLVEVDAIVLDRQGRFVPDLVQNDFEIIENGKPQALASFAVVNLPLDPPPVAAGRVVGADIQSNARPFNGRLYLIVIDDLHVSQPRTNAARRIARQFIERTLAPDDLAAVVVTSGNRRVSADFTNDRRALLAAVNKMVGQKIVSPSLATLGNAATPDDGTADKAKLQRMFHARSSLETLTYLASFAGTIRSRRKAMILIGEGIDYDLGSSDSTPREMRDRLLDVIGMANRANLSLYAFDPRVFSQLGDDFVDIASTPPGDTRTLSEDGYVVSTEGSGTPVSSQKPVEEIIKSVMVQNDLESAQSNLRTLAGNTGGFAVTGSPKAATGAFDRVRRESSNYYLLGFYPAGDPHDGKFHTITVRVKRAGLSLKARKGYLAPKAAPAPTPAVEVKVGTSPELREALAATLPVSGLTLRATAIPFKGNGANASVAIIVQADGRDLLFTPNDDKLVDSIELAVVALDEQGRTRGGEHVTLDMPLSPQVQAYVAEAGLVFQTRVELPPGEYQLRIGGRDAGSGKVGSVHYAIEVPDFAGSSFSMSGLVISAEQAGQVPSPKPDEELRRLLPGTPITGRDFFRSDTVVAMAEVYDSQRDPSRTVEIASVVEAEDGRVVFKQAGQRAGAEFQGARASCGYTVQVPLQSFTPGGYVLRVQARSSLQPNKPETREIPFRVR